MTFAAWRSLLTAKPQLRFCLRLTLSALLAFALAHLWTFPLGGLWAVLTAIIVTQMSIGGSLMAVTEYAIGTLAGAIYAAGVSLLIPHTTTLALVFALACTVAPVALVAAHNSMFRVAPFTAAIVLLISTEYGESPIQSATYRIFEVMIGGFSVVLISFLVLPERAHKRALKAGAAIMDKFAASLPTLLGGFTQALQLDDILQIQEELGKALAQFQALLAETKKERLTYIHPETDLASLARTLLRLRHDFVIIGRAATETLPSVFAERLPPILRQITQTSADYLHGCSEALVSRKGPPDAEPLDTAFAKHEAELQALQKEGWFQTLSSHEMERIFALGFALDGLHRHLSDLQRSIRENARINTPS